MGRRSGDIVGRYLVKQKLTATNNHIKLQSRSGSYAPRFSTQNAVATHPASGEPVGGCSSTVGVCLVWASLVLVTKSSGNVLHQVLQYITRCSDAPFRRKSAGRYQTTNQLPPAVLALKLNIRIHQKFSHVTRM